MNKQKIIVPKGIRYLSNWPNFSLPLSPSIINKTLTGCGFTEFCIRNSDNIILCSPRKILLENKEEQHKGEVFYVRNELDKILEIDKDLTVEKGKVKEEILPTEAEIKLFSESVNKLKEQVRDYVSKCIFFNRPCKILVTYDSFRHVKEALGNSIDNFHIVVDEFQSIFTDSRFKSSTEMEFLNYLQDLQKVCFVSATPMMDNYLDMLDEFKDLPYYELDWSSEDGARVIKPQLEVRSCKSILSVADEIIQSYKSKDFQKFTFLDSDGNLQEIQSREAVIYVNSVKNICDIIRKAKLTQDDCNILCAKTPENTEKIRKAFGLRKAEFRGLGSVPTKGEQHKMFTFCTRTVYLGSDFYSTNARSFILSDANIDCLAVDITLDLPQILGRQRLNENPWKNRAELYFKSINGKNVKSAADFATRLKQKCEKTEGLLRAYESVDNRDKHYLADNYQFVAKSKNYRDDYVAVNTHGGKDLFPVFNNLVMVSEMRAFEVQQVDYKDRFSVFNTISEDNTIVRDDLYMFLEEFNKLGQFTDKMRLLCSVPAENKNLLGSILESIPIVYKNYYLTLGVSTILKYSCRKCELEAEYTRKKRGGETICELKFIIYAQFPIGKRLTLSEVKEELKKIYLNLGIEDAPKATDLEKFFNVRPVLLKVEDKSSRQKGFEILSRKEDK